MVKSSHMPDDPAVTLGNQAPLLPTDQEGIVLAPSAKAGLDRLAAVLSQHDPATCILLVEDDENDSLLIQRAFREVDDKLRVFMVENGVSAIDYLEGNFQFSDRFKFPIPGAIILDLGLPDTSGIEVLRHIRQTPHLKSAVVIALTGSDSGPNAEKAQDLGVSAYLRKPMSGNYVDVVQSLRLAGLI
jgi:CheY-like chemotaxis protein